MRTQVIALVFSADRKTTPRRRHQCRRRCARTSDIPFSATVGPPVRVGRVDGEFVINPTYAEPRTQMAPHRQHMVVGHKDGIVMIGSGAKEETEEVILAAIEFAHTEIKKICAAIDELVKLAGKPKRAFTAPEFDEVYYAGSRPRLAIVSRTLSTPKTHGQDRKLRAHQADQGRARRGIAR